MAQVIALAEDRHFIRKELAVTLDLPHHGPLRGMGVRRGITLIAGGGCHGRSTLLEALEGASTTTSSGMAGSTPSPTPPP